MKIIFVNIYSTDTMAEYLLSSYVLKAYIESVSDGDSPGIEVLNFSSGSSPEEIADSINSRSPDVAGFSCYVWNIESVLSVAEQLRKTTGAARIFGGPEITIERIATFSDPRVADYYVVGEGEVTLKELLEAIRPGCGKAVAMPPGVAYWDGGKIAFNKREGRITNLDSIPSVYLSGAMESRHYDRGQAFLETQRGCRFKCKYCVYHKNLSSISYYSLERIFDELRFLIEEKNIQALRIFDSVFTSDLGRAKSIVEFLIDLRDSAGVRLPWIYWEYTYNSIDEEFLELLSGLKTKEFILNSSEVEPVDRPQHYSELLRDYTAINCVGVQSFNRDSLRSVNRMKVDRDRFGEFMGLMKKFNLVLKADLILGLPYETIDTYFDGLEYFAEFFRGTDHILNIHRLQILPGSDLEKCCGEFGIDYSAAAPHNVFATSTMSREDMNTASRLTALIFRILNSPLREKYFEAKNRSKLSVRVIAEKIYQLMISDDTVNKSRLVVSELVDDSYWNREVFEEIKSEWLVKTLNSI
ncbi:MAG TPA: cobalamin-dependent protein [bacterium]|nr:cobalamin-dependent protein [bacterium]